MRPRLLLAGLVMGASITAGCGILLDLSHLDDGTGTTGTGGAGATTSSGSGGSGGTGGSHAISASVSTTSTASVGSSSSSGDASSSSSASSGSGTGGAVGAPGIKIKGAGGMAADFTIDATEVTVAQYAAFVTAFEAQSPANQKQHDVCGWNHSVRPNTVTANDAGIATAPECDTFNLDTENATHPTRPIRCIDWCDGAAYCLWAGGHMCHGNEGNAAYPVEWKTACAGPVNLIFPYGNTYEAGRCIDVTVAPPGVANVKSKATCEGGYSGVFDMSGNVAEWLDCGCEYDNPDSTKTNAFIGGGAYHNTDDELNCTPVNTSPIIGFRKDVGVRCCYDDP